ncbi:MAG TPA: SoxR reducing system RseC family protein [Legionella sp.]|nr:SoxR reducing system RseC family protein [Legionella sp.]
MESNLTERISAIIPNEEELEKAVTQLLAESVARSDISVQGNPKQLSEKYGFSTVKPGDIQNSTYPPVKEPFLNDDFGWVVGLSFAIPLFICLIIGIFVIGDINSNSDIIIYGLLGAIIGSLIGYGISKTIKSNREQSIDLQEERGGFVLWVVTHSPEQHHQVMNILKEHHPKNIRG